MAIKEAREKALDDFEWVGQGLDPRDRGLLVGDLKPLTIKEAIYYWYENYGKANRLAPESVLRQLTTLIPKEWLRINIEKMSAIDWANLYRGISKNNNKGYGLNCIIELRTINRYCISEGKAKRADFESLSPGNYCRPYEERERFLDPMEIGLILRNLNESSLEERNQLVFLLVLVFGCRENELCLAKSEHFDLKQRIWTVPRSNLKGGNSAKGKITKDLRRPIPEVMIPYIERMIEISKGSPYVLINRRDMSKPVPPSSLSKIAATLRDELDMKHWVMHDLRTTISTLLTDMGCPIYLPDKLIGHILKGTMRKYNRSEMLPELDKLLKIWCDKLFLWKEKPTNIIELYKNTA